MRSMPYDLIAMESDGDSSLLWERRHAELVKWRAERGNCNVPKAEGKLGRWVVRQRELQKKGKLERGRKKMLDELDFVWNTNEAAWETRYAQLKDYATANGHCCVPISDPVLGMWVAKMRANRRRGKLPAHRIHKLDQLAFVWNTAEADWMDKFDKLLAFRDREGHACVRFNEGELGWWVNTQRQSKRKGKLSAQREQLLNEAGFVWNPQEFLAARRREAATAKARAASSSPVQPPVLRKRPANVTFSSGPLSQIHQTNGNSSPKRQKLPLSPPHLKPLFRGLTDSAGPTSATRYRSAGSETALGTDLLFSDTPLSNVTLANRRGRMRLQSSPHGAESMSSPPTDRVDVQSIASLLSPSMSPMPLQRGQTIAQASNPVGELPSFHNVGIAAGFMPGTRKPPSPHGFVLPPISSLKVLTEISRQ